VAKTIHEERIKENFDIHSFSLDGENMKSIGTLDEKRSSFFSRQDPAVIEWFGQPILERRKQN